MKTRSLLLFSTLAVMLSTDAIAATGKVFREPDGAVTVYDLPAGEPVQFGVDAAPSRSLTTNGCGLLVINPNDSYPSGTVQVGNQVINPATLPTQLLPTCRRDAGGSYALDEARTSHFVNASNGALVVVTNSPNTRMSITYPGLYRLTTRRVNACGFLRLRETESLNFNEFLLLPTTGSALAEFRVDALTTLNGLLCARGNLYYPANWQGFPTAEALPGSEIGEALLAGVRAIASPSGQVLASRGSAGGGSTEGDATDGGSDGTTDGGSAGGSTGGTSSDGSGSTGDTSSGESSGGSTGGSSADLSNFTEATYNPSQHDYNGDGLVDDANGDGIPDDRDGDGFPDGPWGPSDFANSAGSGLTLPPGASACFGYDGSLVAWASFFVRGQTYRFWVGGWSQDLDGDTSPATYGAGSPPLARFQHPQGKRYDDPIFMEYEDSTAMGIITDLDDEQEETFDMDSVQSCLIPPWMN